MAREPEVTVRVKCRQCEIELGLFTTKRSTALKMVALIFCGAVCRDTWATAKNEPDKQEPKLD